MRQAILLFSLVFLAGAQLPLKAQEAFTLIFPSENLELTEKGEKENGLRSGLWIAYSKDSSYIHRGNYFEGKKSGYWNIFIDGVERARLSYRNDSLNGPYYLFYPNRVVAVKAIFAHNQLNGEWGAIGIYL